EVVRSASGPNYAAADRGGIAPDDNEFCAGEFARQLWQTVIILRRLAAPDGGAFAGRVLFADRLGGRTDVHARRNGSAIHAMPAGALVPEFPAFQPIRLRLSSGEQWPHDGEFPFIQQRDLRMLVQ